MKIRIAIIVALILSSCNNSVTDQQAALSDSCRTAVPFENSKVAEAMVQPGYSGELKNYWGDDTSKLDFVHVYDKGRITSSRFYFENGRLQEEYHYRCGSLHGQQSRYYQNGNLEKLVSYRYGRMNGPASKYDSLGNLRSRALFINDSLISEENLNSMSR